MATDVEILDSALDVLRRGDSLTMDSVAREAGLTKPGVVHHFATKETLAVAVVDRLVDLWEAELLARVDADSDESERLRAYLDYALMGDLDPSDLALIADVRLRDKLRDRWITRLDPWFGEGQADDVTRPSLRAARFIADGAWFDRALGIVDYDEHERSAILKVAMDLIGAGR